MSVCNHVCCAGGVCLYVGQDASLAYNTAYNINALGAWNALGAQNSIPPKTVEYVATKHDADKAPMELLSHEALLEIAKVFGFGAKKYGRFNYREGMEWSRVVGAAYRHLGAFNSGEDLDPESGLTHLAHLGCCVMMLLDYYREHKSKDDRYKGVK